MQKPKRRSIIAGQVLLCAPFGKDTEILTEIVSSEGLGVTHCASLNEMAQKVSERTDFVLLTEEALVSTSLQAIQRTLRKQEPWSDIPIILLASAGPTPSRWTTGFVSKLGDDANISILERPVRVPTIISVLRSAKRARNRQRQVQRLLLQEKESASKLRTARDELEQRVEERTAAARQLSARLLQMQDEERRRIARELHDSAGQMVAALTMNIDQMKADDGSTGEQARLLADSDAVLRNLNKELRTMSHLLHPPLLDEMGLSSALEWYVDGFGKRSGILTTLELASDFGRVNSDLEIAVFRLVQECLTNVHRHSGSSKAVVRLKRSRQAVMLEIEDEGHGIAPEKQSVLLGSGPVGVGLRGMRERVLQLGGTLHIDSEDGGTTIRAMFPIAKAAAVSPQEVA
jgi:signal transduction histidine kinase